MPVPTVTSVVPSAGQPPSPVLIIGTNLADVTAVNFGGYPSTILQTDRVLGTWVYVVPPRYYGTVDVTAVNPSGTSAVTPRTRYTYVGGPVPGRPTVTSVTPNSGPASGGQTVVITGTGFVPGVTQVIFG
ncbi:IPT/TIG domain-containing protein [Streptomyces cucumeris]|uniref:IPT/TIG domain-containing protein n=1 Tax=Streptomyces cucumeris TaxID=2962890 RepID=UPI003D75B9F8